MKTILTLILLLIPVMLQASTAVYDDATQTLTNKTLDCSLNTLTNCAAGTIGGSYQVTFSDSDLNPDNQFTITHSLGTTHYGGVVVYDNNSVPVSGYTLKPTDTNSAVLDLTGFGTIPGAANSWTIEILSGN